MRHFKEAFEKTMGHEGGYANDPDDAGGETYRGISRRYNPSWPGWVHVDRMRGLGDFPQCLYSHQDLNSMVEDCYKQQYFDVFRGDDLPKALAMEMFDTAVNMGVGRAALFLQVALNVLNKNGALWNDLVEDGAFGPRTYATLQTALADGNEDLIVKIMNVLQGAHYIEYMKKSPIQEKYARGWFNRVEISK